MDDPHPEFRCCCVTLNWPTSPYNDRCLRRPTQEDGLCDSCRVECRRRKNFTTVPLLTPCQALPAEVPF